MMKSDQETRFLELTKTVNDPIAAAIIMLAEILATTVFFEPKKPPKP